MAGGVNKVLLIGNLGADPELKTIPNGTPVCTFNLATNEDWKGKDGEKHDHTEWHRIKAWRKTAELCSKYLHKGSKVFLEGRIRTSSYEDKEGNRRYSTEVEASSVTFLDGKDSGSGDTGGHGARGKQEDDIPF